jgi:hypothetical protein
MASCALQPGNFRPVGNGSIHCSCYIRMKGRHQDRQLHATVAANRDSGTCCVRRRLSPRTHVVHAPPLSLFLSLHQCNLLPLSDKRESRVLSSLWLTFYVFLLSSPWRERLSHFFFLLLPSAICGSKATETWDQAPSLVQFTHTTNQRK